MSERENNERLEKRLYELLGETLDEELKEEKRARKPKEERKSAELEEKREKGRLWQESVYPVYILRRVIVETSVICRRAMPKEAIGVLLGFKRQYKGKKYVKIVDWVTGKANQSSAFAEFTPEGVRQYTTIIEERYGESENRPRIVGIFHSHPFGFEPHFSATDYNTFLNFPYDAEHNVFVLIDPKSGYYKSYIVVVREDGQKDLEEVNWVEYNAR